MKNEGSIAPQLENEFKKVMQEITVIKLDQQETKRKFNSLETKIDELNEKCEEIRESLSLAATREELEKIIAKLNSKVSLELFLSFQNQLEFCANQAEVQTLHEQISILKTEIESIQTESLSSLKEEVQREFDEKIQKIPQNYLSELPSVISEVNNYISTVENKLERLKDHQAKEMKEALSKISSKTSRKNFQKLQNEVNEKVSNSEFREVKNNLTERLKDESERVSNLFSKAKKFSEVLERFDELITDKASKDDVTEVRSSLKAYLKYSLFESFSQKVWNQLTIMEHSNQEVDREIKRFEKEIQNFYSEYNLFRVELNKFYNLYRSVETLKQDIDSKADKTAVSWITKHSASTEQTKLLEESLVKFQKQLEAHVYLTAVNLKAEIKEFDSKVRTVREKMDMYNNFTSLLKWVTNSKLPEPKDFRKATNPKRIKSKRNTPELYTPKPKLLNFEEGSSRTPVPNLLDLPPL